MWLKLLMTSFCFSPLVLHAQTDIHKFRLQEISFQYTSTLPGVGRCLQWLPLDEDNARPTLEYDAQGNPFLRANVRARVSGDCRIKIENQSAMKILDREGEIASFEVRVLPPATRVVVSGKDFRDELLLEAPIKKIEETSFLTVFRRSRVAFETRYARLSTTNSVAQKSATIFPVFGGVFVFPLWGNFHSGFSIFNNLGNLSSNKLVDVQYSEFAFDVRYLFQPISRNPDSLLLTPVLDYRGRNIYQTSFTRPFIIGSVALPGFGFDLQSFPFLSANGTSSKLRNLALDFSTRLYLGGRVGGRPYRAYLYDIAVGYKVNKKWALSLGYASLNQQATFSGVTATKVTEKMSSVFARISLIPYSRGPK